MLTMMLLVAAQAAPVPALKAEDKVVCRAEHEVHSRIPRRVCMTKSGWDRISTEAQEDMTRSVRQRGHIPPSAIGYNNSGPQWRGLMDKDGL